MDSHCNVKPDSQLNRGSGSNSSEYIISMESGTETEVFLLIIVLFLSASVSAFSLCSSWFLRAQGCACVPAGEHAERRRPGADDTLPEGGGADVSGGVASGSRWSGAGSLHLLEETQLWAAQPTAQRLQQPAHKGETTSRSICCIYGSYQYDFER